MPRTSTKKPTIKTTKKTPNKKVIFRLDEPATILSCEPVESISVPSVSSTRIVYLASCKSCHHVPLGVNAMMAVLVAIIFTLSAMLMSASVSLRSPISPVQASLPVTERVAQN